MTAISFIKGTIRSTRNGNNDIPIIGVTSSTKLAIDENGEVVTTKIKIGWEVTTCVV